MTAPTPSPIVVRSGPCFQIDASSVVPTSLMKYVLFLSAHLDSPVSSLEQNGRTGRKTVVQHWMSQQHSGGSVGWRGGRFITVPVHLSTREQCNTQAHCPRILPLLFLNPALHKYISNSWQIHINLDKYIHKFRHFWQLWCPSALLPYSPTLTRQVSFQIKKIGPCFDEPVFTARRDSWESRNGRLIRYAYLLLFENTGNTDPQQISFNSDNNKVECQ